MKNKFYVTLNIIAICSVIPWIGCDEANQNNKEKIRNAAAADEVFQEEEKQEEEKQEQEEELQNNSNEY